MHDDMLTLCANYFQLVAELTFTKIRTWLRR